MSTWLVTGANGQLGTHALPLLAAAGIDVVATTRAELDLGDPEQVEAMIAEHRPDVVLNAAAYTAVDAAEDDEAGADRINRAGPAAVAEALARHGGRLLHVSTDYVFAGDASEPYEVDAPVGPTGAYGRTKLAGEQAVARALPDRHHVVRTAWVYGGPTANFVDTMTRLERERETLTVVNDQIGSPTWVADLAGALVELGRGDVPAGTLHYVNAGQASWFELARAVFRLIGADPERVQPVDSAAFPRPAKRPGWSVLSTRAWVAAGLTAPRPWQDALAEALAGRRAATAGGR
ncbi:dTDP-4-dehydrorhamnose reductase [uncultured Jatrophihabitans sp.]|uniref:dTDP-4-dehydrorhamnose reductase n=1 Tax=uncultured Jatrophihabitans sp. TaxID=1610747 RepID=UPI0035C948C5